MDDYKGGDMLKVSKTINIIKFSRSLGSMVTPIMPLKFKFSTYCHGGDERGEKFKKKSLIKTMDSILISVMLDFFLNFSPLSSPP